MDFSKILSNSTKKPQNILKLVLTFSVALLVIWLFLASRMEFNTSPNVQDPEVQQRTEGLKNSLIERERAREEAEADSLIASMEAAGITADSARIAVAETAQVKSGNERAQASGIFANALTTFSLMIMLLGGVWFWSKKKESAPAKKEDQREVGSYVLGQGTQLKFIEINNEIWVMGMTAGSLDLLHRVPKSEWTEPMPDQHTPVKLNGTADFKSLYKFFKN